MSLPTARHSSPTCKNARPEAAMLDAENLADLPLRRPAPLRTRSQACGQAVLENIVRRRHRTLCRCVYRVHICSFHSYCFFSLFIAECSTGQESFSEHIFSFNNLPHTCGPQQYYCTEATPSIHTRSQDNISNIQISHTDTHSNTTITFPGKEAESTFCLETR